MKTQVLLQKIKKEFPEISWKSVKRPKDNWDYDVLLLGDKYVFRFLKVKNKEEIEGFAKEIKLLDYLKNKVNISIPNYIFRSKDGSFGGYEMIKGYELTPEEFGKIQARDRKKLSLQLAQFLNILHKTPKKYFSKETAAGDGGGLEKLHLRMKKTVYKKISEKEAKDIDAFFDDFKKMKKRSKKRVLVHGDLTNGNMLYKNGRISGIIDFADFRLDSPAIDFNGLWDFGEEFVKMAIKDYGEKNDKLLLKHSKSYYRIIALYILDGAVNYKHSPINFRDGHKRFKEIFYID
jgi:aminoglycoside phosphotransferase (APT) family kinase protein